MQRSENIGSWIDWWSLILYEALLAMGWAMVYAVEYRGENSVLFDLSTQYGKQLLWIAISLATGLAILIIDHKFYITFSWFLYILAIAALVGVLVLAPEVKGARSWFSIGAFKLQPSELAKFATALALARYLTGLNVSLRKGRHRIAALGIILLPAGLILLQPDPGSALVFLGLTLALYREGFPAWPMWLILALGFLFLATILWGSLPVLAGLAVIWLLASLLSLRRKRQARSRLFSLLLGFVLLGGFVQVAVPFTFNHILKEHHRNRINVILGKETTRGADYNVMQSKIAISSGGLSGKGYLQGTITKGEFVPEQSTDFIFSTVGEEFGFLGSLLVIGLFTAFLLRLIALAERQRSRFSRIYGYAVVSIFLVHVIINIAMATGVFPVVGIPLPFFSYGGSALLGFSILFFIMLKLDATRKLIFR